MLKSMEVIKTFVFSAEEYQDTILKKVVCGYDFDKEEYNEFYSAPFSINGRPLFRRIIVYVGENKIKVERPYFKNERPMGSTTYYQTLIDVHSKAIEEVKEFLNIK